MFISICVLNEFVQSMLKWLSALAKVFSCPCLLICTSKYHNGGTLSLSLSIGTTNGSIPAWQMVKTGCPGFACLWGCTRTTSRWNVLIVQCHSINWIADLSAITIPLNNLNTGLVHYAGSQGIKWLCSALTHHRTVSHMTYSGDHTGHSNNRLI